MKPLNLDNSPCSPISSNCIIWQGPDIPCIKLCKGDTISDVIFKLATELCTIMETLKVSNYDLECFNLVACPPSNFEELIQFLINKICELQLEVDAATVVTVATTGITKSTSADTLVTVAPCFIVGTTTVMTIAEYATAMGTAICGILDQITIINATISTLDIRVTALERIPVPTTVIPSFTLSCVIGTLPSGSVNFINVILEEFINNVWCSYVAATGDASNILSGISAICIADTDLQLTNGAAFSTNPFWIQNASYATLGDAVNNLWVALCDVYNYALSLGVTVADTATVNLDMTANVITAKITDTGWKDLDGFSYYGVGVEKPKCRRIGNALHFKGNVFIPLENPSSPGNVVVLSALDAYNGITGCTVWSGTGGCTISADGYIQFNNGGSIIPNSITVNNIDDTYGLGYIISTRQIDVDPTYGTALSSVLNISINSTNGLTVGVLNDVEISTTRGSGVLGDSPLRFVTSNVRVGEYLPNYIAATTDIHNAPSNALFPLQSNTFNLTWPFTCDAGSQSQIGGFTFKLDGLIAYLEPCNIETGLSIVCP